MGCSTNLAPGSETAGGKGVVRFVAGVPFYARTIPPSGLKSTVVPFKAEPRHCTRFNAVDGGVAVVAPGVVETRLGRLR